MKKPKHPGVYFRDHYIPEGMSIGEVAKHLCVSRKHVSAFVNETLPCKLDMAKRIAIATDTSVSEWLHRQAMLDEWEFSHNDLGDYSKVKPLY